MKFKNCVNIYCDRNGNSGYLERREGLSGKGHMGTLMCGGNVLCLDVTDGYVCVYVGVYVCQISSWSLKTCAVYLHKAWVLKTRDLGALKEWKKSNMLGLKRKNCG